MKNGDYVIAPINCAEYLTAGKKYQVFDVKEKNGEFLFSILDDEDDNLITSLKGSSHLNLEDWILATESEDFLKEVEIGYKHITTASGENLILGSELIDDSFNFVRFVTDTNSNSFEPTAILNVDNPIGDFLLKNGFELSTYEIDSFTKERYVRNDTTIEIFNSYYKISTREGEVYSQDLNIYWLIGYLTYYNLIDREYKI